MSIIQGTSKTSAAAAYEISQSVRFNDDDSAYLEKTFASAGDRQIWTWSAWIKLSGSTARQIIFGAATGPSYISINENATGSAFFNLYNAGWYWETAAKYRDPSAWYHLVWAFDTTNATADSRMRFYVNGSEVTDYSTKHTTGSQNASGGINNNVVHRIGRHPASTNYYDGYLAEINFVDGQQLAPTDFGETNADTGQWVPVRYTGSYGSNGFYITGADSADLGADDSGNGNDFTSSGLAAADQVSDSPTDNYATLNPLLKHSSVTLADGNLEASTGTNGWFGSVGTVGIQLGDKVYFEGKCLTNTRLYFGLSRVNGSGGTIKPESDSTFEGGQSDTDYMWRVTSANTVYYQTTNQSVTVSAVAVNDIVGCSVDTDGTVKFYKNGTEIHSFSTTLIAGDTYMPVYSVNGATSTEKWEVRFGSTGVSHQPAGFSLLRTSDMPDPTIADPSAYFDTLIWSGDSSNKNITGLNFTPDFLWIKQRNSAFSVGHQLYDVVRGAGSENELDSSSTAAEGAGNPDVYGYPSAFVSGGFTATAGSSGDWDYVNKSGVTYVAWNWLADNTTGSSNTDGDITSTVSADTTAGFSIVTATPSLTGTENIGHGLGLAPKMILGKNLDLADNWYVYHDAISPAQSISLNTTGAATTTRYNAATTSSVFQIVNAAWTNGGQECLWYCFAEVEGFSKITSYESNSNIDGPFIYCGFRPSFVMIKNADAGEDWWIQDAAREPFNGGNMARIAPNSSAAEADNVAWFDFVSNGLKVRYNAGGINSSGTHIVMAFAESPFRYANAR